MKIKSIINKELSSESVHTVLRQLCENIFVNGPSDNNDLQLLSYFQMYYPSQFKEYKTDLFQMMGLNYKRGQDVIQENKLGLLTGVVAKMYNQSIVEQFNATYTPVQADITNRIQSNQIYSFSAPTSTGKSFVFMQEINKVKGDVVIIVPSRALLNEFYLKLADSLQDKKNINLLMSVAIVNRKHANRNIFILTPERCRELFQYKEKFNIDLFLFDEAQLCDEKAYGSYRGLYFDGIIRRCYKAYTGAKFVFAHPFIQNPEAQIKRNHFPQETSAFKSYNFKSVGQIFLSIASDSNSMKYFNPFVPRENGVKCEENHLESIISRENPGSILIYTTKASILKGKAYKTYKHYIDLCPKLSREQYEPYQERLRKYTGATPSVNGDFYSKMLENLERGIIIHHGSLPLHIRQVFEDFTKSKHCRICFATSTLAQGINMPFDAVILDTFSDKRELDMLNLLGRAGRSTPEFNLDFGIVVVKETNKSQLRNLFSKSQTLEAVSRLDTQVDDESLDEKHNEFSTAIINDTFDDRYSLPSIQVEQLTKYEFQVSLTMLLSRIEPLSRNTLSSYLDLFMTIYRQHLGRSLTRGETLIVRQGIYIMLLLSLGDSFKTICKMRYLGLKKSWFLPKYAPLPDKSGKIIALFDKELSTSQRQFDFVIFDTYDYIDKLIGFYLSDIFVAALSELKPYVRDIQIIGLINRLINLIRYGTLDEKQIMLLKYGFSREEIEELDSLVKSVDENEIVFDEDLSSLSDDILRHVERFKN